MEEFEKKSQKLSKVQLFISKYGWKHFKKNNLTIALNLLIVKKNENISCLHFKTQLKFWETDHSFNDSKWRRMSLSYSRKTIHIIKKNNDKT